MRRILSGRWTRCHSREEKRSGGVAEAPPTDCRGGGRGRGGGGGEERGEGGVSESESRDAGRTPQEAFDDVFRKRAGR